MPASPPRFGSLPLVAGAIAMVAQAALGWWLGADLHMVFGGVLIAALVVSPLAAVTATRLEAACVMAVIVVGIGLGWLMSPTRGGMTRSTFFQCMIVMLCWTFCVASISRLCARLFREPTLGSATTTLLALAWLAAPIWLGTHAVPIVKFHPLFAMNVVLIDLGLWTEQPFEYRYLFALGQDVPYLLPPSILPCCAVHALIGLVSAAAGFSPMLRRFERPTHLNPQMNPVNSNE